MVERAAFNRVGQQGTLTRIWGRRGTRPRAPRDRRYAWAYLFGAVCPARAVGAGLVLPYANTEAMHLHLEAISRHVAPGAHAVLVLDGVGWHGLAALGEIPRNLTLLPLPPYRGCVGVSAAVYANAAPDSGR